MNQLKLLTAVSVMIALNGCVRIETGSVGILKHFNGTISTEPQTGMVITVLDSIVADVDTTETRLPIVGIRPTDSNGVLLDQLDLIVSFRMTADKVPGFYIQTKELDHYTDDAGRKIETVGLKVLENTVKHSIQEETKKEAVLDLASNLSDYESKILAQSQLELDKGYPGVFTIIRVNVNHFTPPAAILEQANQTARLRGEAARIAQEQTLIAARTALEESKAQVDAMALRSAMDASHLSAEQLIAWKNARAYEVQARAVGETAVRIIDPTKPPIR